MLSYLIIPLEMAVAGFIGFKVHQLRQQFKANGKNAKQHLDFFDVLRMSTQDLLKNRFVAGALASEIARLYYVSRLWKKPPPTSGRDGFTYHSKNGYQNLLIALLLMGSFEMIGVHLLVLQWSPLVAWILTGLGFYSCLWIMGLLASVKQRPIVLYSDSLKICIGILWTIHVPLEYIESIRSVDSEGFDFKQSDYVKAVSMGTPDFVLQLKEPVVAYGPYGTQKQTTQIGLTVDAPQRFQYKLDDMGVMFQ